MLPGSGSSFSSCKGSCQTSGFRKSLSSLHHLWVTPQKSQMVWDPGNDTPVPTYLQWYRYIQWSQPGYSQFADSQTPLSADWIGSEAWSGIMPLYIYPTCSKPSQCHTFSLHVADLPSEGTCVWLTTHTWGLRLDFGSVSTSVGLTSGGWAGVWTGLLQVTFLQWYPQGWRENRSKLV